MINIVKSKDDRRRIMQLLQFAEPIEKSKVVFFDRRPESNNVPKEGNSAFPNTLFRGEKKNNFKNVRSSSSNKLRTYRKNKNKKTYDDFTRTNRKPPIEAKETKVKTIMFPNDEKELYFNEENRCLNKQKEELKEIYDNMLIKLNEEDKLRDEEMRLQTINMNKNLDNLGKKNKNLKNSNRSLTKKFMDLKYDTNQNNQKLNDEIEITKLQREALKKSINELIKKSKLDKEINKKDFDRRTRQVANNLRSQVKTKEETANLAKKQFKDIQQMYLDKIEEARNKIQTTENKYNLLKEGYFNEEEYKKQIHEIEVNIRLFRAKMKEFEEYINVIKRLTEGDYNHFDEIQDITGKNNKLFMDETQKIDDDLTILAAFLSERHKENMEFLKKVQDQFDENGLMFGNDENNNQENSQNEIIEEEEEKQPEAV